MEPSSQKRRRPWLRIVGLASVLVIATGGAVGWYIVSHRPRRAEGLLGPLFQGFQAVADQMTQGTTSAGDFLQKLAGDHLDDAYAATTAAFRKAVTRQRFERYVREQPAFHQPSVQFDFSIVSGAATVTFTPAPGQAPDNKVHLTLVPEDGRLKVNRLQVNGQALP